MIKMKTDVNFSLVESNVRYSLNTLEFGDKMQHSSPDCDLNGGSLLYNDSGYLTNTNHEPQSLSTNSEPSLEAGEELSLHSKQRECLTAIHTSNIYFCEDAVFDEPKLEGPPLLCDNSNNYEEFSSLIKFSLEDTSSSYLTNDVYVPDNIKYSVSSKQDSSDKLSSASKDSTNVLQYFDQDSLSSYSSINTSQSICVSRLTDKQNIIAEAAEECLTANMSPQDVSIVSNENQITQDSECINSSPIQNENVECNSMNMENEHTLHENVNNLECNDKNSKIGKLIATPTKTFVNPVNPNLSPELFSDDESQTETSLILHNTSNISLTQKSFLQSEQLINNDRKLLKRLQETLSGVPPPPSVTILQITVSEILDKINNNKNFNLSKSYRETESVITDNDNNCFKNDRKPFKSLLVVNSKEEVLNYEWPNILDYRYHGLNYNRSKVSEDFEHYCTKYASRYVGCETTSSCTVWSTTAPSSATKRRNSKLRWGVKSPGKRLSHLARRRITFSSSNLQQAGTSLSVIGNSLGSRQLMIDARKNTSHRRKSPRKSPWKKSPQKRVRTPGSSTKKRAARRLVLGGEDEPKPSTSKVSSTKRALFQSPDHTRSKISSTDSATQFLQANKSTRALFVSPSKRSPSKNSDRKRKRIDEECHPNKFPRSLSFDVHHSSALNAAASSSVLQRRHSEIINRPSASRGELSDLHRKKLLWAVSEALRGQQIGMSHPQFRTYATVLCKIVKCLMPDLLSNGPRQPGSTSDRMLRIAHQHCYAVTRGKSFDEILQQAKETSANLKNLKPPSGYVAPDTHKSPAKVKNVLQDKIMNIETNYSRGMSNRSPADVKLETKHDENNRVRIRRQITFDGVELSKSFNSNR